MTLPTLPFSNEDVQEAFPNLVVSGVPLGQGSFKVAYHAHSDGEARVLKIIFSFQIEDDPDEFDMDQIPERIARELTGMSQVESAHLVSLLSDPVIRRIGTASYLCYEEPFYAGGTLEERLKDGPLGREQVRELIVALLVASKALWDKNKIVHRDIKPGNIAFDSSGVPVLLDLGLVLFTQLSALTASEQASPKTPRYAAPEQFEMRRNAQIDFRTDQYLIGLTVFEAATGRHPFWREGILLHEYMDAVENFRATNLNALEFDDDVRTIVSRLLSPEMHGRYRTPDMPLQRLGVSL